MFKIAIEIIIIGAGKATKWNIVSYWQQLVKQSISVIFFSKQKHSLEPCLTKLYKIIKSLLITTKIQNYIFLRL